MKNIKHYLLNARMIVAAFALIAIGSFALGQQANNGFWSNFPIIGGSSYCSSSVNNVCVNTVPAGPSPTGNESIPADTNANSGPATAKFKAAAIGIGPYTYNAPLTGATITTAANTRYLILNPAGTISTLTVVMPPSPVDGQLFNLCTTQIVTSLTLSAGTGTTIKNAPTALLVPVTTGGASCPGWLSRSTDATWYRTQ